MKKVLLLLLAIFSISIAASAKQQVIVSDGFDYDYDQANTTLYLQTGTHTFDNGNKWYAYNPNISSTTATVIYHTKNTAYLISGKRSIYFNNSGNAADRSYVVLYTPIKTNGVITIKAKSYGSSNKMRGGIYKMNPTFNAAGTTITSCTVGAALVTFPETIVSNVTTYTVNVEASEGNPVYIGLSSNGAVLDDFTFTAILPNTVSGTIKDTNGVLIEGASVVLKQGDTEISATTAADGTYTFGTDAVADGTYTLTVTASGHKDYTESIEISDDIVKNIAISPLNTVSGTITSTSATPISGAAVELLKADSSVAYSTTTASDGKYTFGANVIDGSYKLHVTADGYVEYTAESATAISSDVTLDAELTPIVLNYYNFSGAVSYNGVAVEGMQLKLAGGDTDATCTTQEDGKFSFTQVLEGTYTLTVYCTPEYKPCAQTIVLDREITDHEVTLSKYKLEGSVMYVTGEGDEDYVLIEGASVVLKQGDTEIGTATTAADGAFSFSGLSGGDYTLTASAAGFVTDSDVIGLNSGADVDKQFVLERSKSTITGTVMRNDVDVDAALAGIAVQLLAGETVVANATSDAVGAYSLEIVGALAQDGYKLHVAATDYYNEFTSDVTPEYQSSVTENIGLDPVLLEYVAVIENEYGEALEGAAITVAKAAPKQIIDSFEYFNGISGTKVNETLLANGWLEVSTSGSISLEKSAAAQKDGLWSLRIANINDHYGMIVRAAKAGTVSIWTLQYSSAGQVTAYKMKDNGDGSYAIDGSALASKTTDTQWSQLSFTLDEDCFIGFKIKGSYVDYYVNDFGATAAPAYAAPALAAEADETPSTIKITKDPIDLKTFTIAIPKVDYSDETYTATASATGATLLSDPSSSTDVWDFTFSDEKHVSVFTGGTPTGVSDISVDSTDADEAEYYTLQGVRVTNPHSGIYIRRTATTATKVLIR